MNCTDLQVSYVRRDDMEVHIIAATLDIGTGNTSLGSKVYSMECVVYCLSYIY